MYEEVALMGKFVLGGIGVYKNLWTMPVCIRISKLYTGGVFVAQSGGISIPPIHPNQIIPYACIGITIVYYFRINILYYKVLYIKHMHIKCSAYINIITILKPAFCTR